MMNLLLISTSSLSLMVPLELNITAKHSAKCSKNVLQTALVYISPYSTFSSKGTLLQLDPTVRIL